MLPLRAWATQGDHASSRLSVACPGRVVPSVSTKPGLLSLCRGALARLSKTRTGFKCLDSPPDGEKTAAVCHGKGYRYYPLATDVRWPFPRETFVSLRTYCKCKRRAVEVGARSSWYLPSKWVLPATPSPAHKEYTYHSFRTMSRLPHNIPEDPEG